MKPGLAWLGCVGAAAVALAASCGSEFSNGSGGSAGAGASTGGSGNAGLHGGNNGGYAGTPTAGGTGGTITQPGGSGGGGGGVSNGGNGGGGAGPSADGVPCKEDICYAPDFCCFTAGNGYGGAGGAPPPTTCAIGGECTGVGQVPIRCDGPEDCSPDSPVCCHLTNPQRIQCVGDQECTTAMTVCHGPNTCPPQWNCCAVMTGLISLCSQASCP